MNRNRSGRRYDREFKDNAVALVQSGRPITEVARETRGEPSATIAWPHSSPVIAAANMLPKVDHLASPRAFIPGSFPNVGVR